jgi:hypothetical protein
LDISIYPNNRRDISKTPKGLLASRFNTLDELKTIVDIDYSKDKNQLPFVKLTYKDQGQIIESILSSGVDQGQLSDAKNSNLLEKIELVKEVPNAIRERNNLKNILLLSRRRSKIFGAGDVAFYDLAEVLVSKINTPNKAFLNRKDSSEKGFINTFNHINAQILITALYSEELADFIADAHELHRMPELLTGNFTNDQLTDSINYPIDNYVDLINNEIGQEIGKELKEKYNITYRTNWSPELLRNFLNDIELYYIRSMGIGFDPFSSDDNFVKKFSKKLNVITSTIPTRL